MIRALCLVLALASLASAQGSRRTPNLALKFGNQQYENDNLMRLDETMGGMMSGPYDPSRSGQVYDRGGMVYNVKNAIFGAKGDGVTDDAVAIQNAVNALPTDGGTVVLPAGDYRISASITIDRPVVLQGAGSGTSASLAATILRPDAGVTAIVLAVTAQKPVVRDLYIRSSSTTSGTDDGVQVRASRTVIDNVTIDNFGRYGVNVDTSSGGNANLSEFRAVRVTGNRSHGFFLDGANSNVIKLIGCDAVSNGGYGYWMDVANTVLIAPHANSNTTGAYYDDGNSTLYLWAYSESGTGNSVLWDTGSSQHVWLGGGYAYPATFTDSGSLNFLFAKGAVGDQTVRNQTLNFYGPLLFKRTAAQANSTLVNSTLGSDTQPRYRVLSNGQMDWGPGGSTAVDTQLTRIGADILGTPDSFRVGLFNRNVPQAVTIADNGAGTAAAATLTPTASYINVTCSDANGCDITMSETGMVDGTVLQITNVSANTVNFADTANVSELAGTFAAAQWDTITMRYVTDRWVETGRSNN